MEDILVTFETAKLAKEKGFNWKNIKILEVKSKSAYLDNTTQSLLQKWLREVHKIDISLDRHVAINGYTYQVFITLSNTNVHEHDWFGYFNTYEEALEKGLQESLRLI